MKERGPKWQGGRLSRLIPDLFMHAGTLAKSYRHLNFHFTLSEMFNITYLTGILGEVEITDA